MAAQLPDFEYDIFISYRQKDNENTISEQGTGWVTQFVGNLRKELAATIKEDISIYFDNNPTDALLETHDVDASLAIKLKCLVFIPVISQTYCDPKSFAWKHEFLAFKNKAKEDGLGLKIRLANGNVASRILPIRIHDLDLQDREILEIEIGPLRSVDFIYKSQGVNRPLRNIDKKEDNQYHFYYRDQLNKTANAIKEIVTAVKAGNSGSPPISHHTKPRAGSSSQTFRKKISYFILALALLSLAMLLYSSDFFSNSRRDSLDRSIAVLPFQNMSMDPEQEYFSDGITIGITNALTRIQGLKVSGQTSAFQFKGQNPDLKMIGEKLGVSNVLEGSVQKQGNTIRITVQLIDITDGYHIWSERFDRNISDGFAVQDEIAKAVTSRFMSTVMRPAEKQHQPNQEAYDLYLKGLHYWNRRGKDLLTGLDYFRESAKADSLFSLAHAGIAESLVLIGRYGLANPTEIMPECKKAAERAIRLDSHCVEAYTALAYEMMIYEWNWDEADRLFRLALDINSNYAPAHYFYGQFLSGIKNDFESGKAHGLRAVEIEPLNAIPHILLAGTYNFHGKFELGLPLLERALTLDPNSLAATGQKAAVLNTLGRHLEALLFIHSASESIRINPWLLLVQCETYVKLGDLANAEKLFNELKQMSESRYVSAMILAETAMSLKRNKEAIYYFEKALIEHSSGLEGYIKDDPNLEKLLTQLRNTK